MVRKSISRFTSDIEPNASAMASLSFVADCPKWLRYSGDVCLCGRSHKGRQHRFASGVRSWAQAEEKREEAQKRLDAGDQTPLPAPETQQTIQQSIKTFLLAKQGERLNDATIRKLRYQLNLFESFLGDRSRFFPSEITPTDVIEYRATWKWKSGVTRQKAQQNLRGFLRSCCRDNLKGLLEVLKPIKLSKADHARLEPQPFTEEELTQLLAQVPKTFPEPEKTARVTALIHCQVATGLAIRDTVQLERDNIKDGWLRIKRQKTDKRVRQKLDPALYPSLRATDQSRTQEGSSRSRRRTLDCRSSPSAILIGTGQLTTTSFAVPEKSLPYWRERLRKGNIEFEDARSDFGEEVLFFRDPDDLQFELVSTSNADPDRVWEHGPVPSEYAIRGFHRVTLSENGYERTASLLTETLGFRQIDKQGSRFRYALADALPGTLIDVVCAPEGRPGRVAVGTVHHLAWRTPTDAEQARWRDTLVEREYDVTPIIDRQYFHSIYFREPGGVLFEIATDPPGFATDETLERLGTSLKLPPWLEAARPQLERLLPPLQPLNISGGQADAAD